MIRSRLQSQSGFSLIEVMVVVAIVGVLSLGIADLTLWTFKSTNAAKWNQERVVLHEEIRQQLSVTAACRNTLAQVNGALNNAANLAIPNIRDQNDTIVYAVGGAPTSIGMITIAAMTLDAAGAGPDSVMATLRINYQTTLEVVGPFSSNVLVTTIPIRLQRDAGGNVVNCLSQAMMSDGIWRRANLVPNDIFFTDGNVGIGTNAPTTLLDVMGTASIGTRLFADRDINNFSGIGARGTGTDAQRIGILMASNPATGLIESLSFRTNDALRMYVLQNGNVGIGTLTADFPLSVGAGARINQVIAGSSSTQVDMAFPYESIGTASNVTNLRMQSPNNIYFHTGMTAAEPDDHSKMRMAITAAGLVGIGTDNPSAHIEVRSETVSPYIRITGPAAQQSAISFSDSTNGEAFTIYRYQNTRDLSFWGSATGTVMHLQHATGNVAIGHQTPSAAAKLDVNGGLTLGTPGPGLDASYFSNNAFVALRNGGNRAMIGMNANELVVREMNRMRIETPLDVTGNLNVNGNINATGSITPSDARLKTDVRPLEEVLEKLLETRPVRYSYIKQPDRERIGVIAQEVEKIFPELVVTTDDGMKGVAYAEFAILAVAGIKELNHRFESELAKIEEDRKQLRSIASEVANLKKENSDLRSQLEEMREQIRRLEPICTRCRDQR